MLNRPSEGHRRTLLWEAVNSNRIPLIKYLIEVGADVNIAGRYRSKTYVLLKPYCIAHRDRREMLKSYLREGGHQDDIFSLAYCGSLEELTNAIHFDKTLLNKPQQEDLHWLVTPLHYALSGQNEESLRWLLDQGAEVKKHSKLLYEMACRQDRLDLVKLLTKYGGSPKEVDVPPVFHHNNSQMIDYFFERGLNADKLLGKDWPPIAYMTRGDKGEHPDRVEKLLLHVTHLNAQTPKGVSAMHTSAKAGYLSIVKLLLDAGAQIDIQDRTGKTPLDYALKFKRKKVAKFLKASGAS